MTPLPVHRHEITLAPDPARVIIRPFIPGEEKRIATIIGRALALTEDELQSALATVRAQFDSRHFDIEGVLRHHYRKILPHLFTERPLSESRQLLIGALFSGEYALESAALFNPSIVPHPDQSDLAEGALRFILSLRAIGEGHISSIEFRSGVIMADGAITVDPVSHYLTEPELLPNPAYRKRAFLAKMGEICRGNGHCSTVFDTLGDYFTLSELRKVIAAVRAEETPRARALHRTLERIEWLAASNYELRFPACLDMSARIIFPVSPNESNGIEDARFVRFANEDGSFIYYASYTAYNGRTILPQLLETRDFLNFRVLTLSGSAVQNKGMALFPRRIHGEFLMLSRQDDENIYLMRSHDPHHWDDPVLLMRPAGMWEAVKIGNCGSPIETAAGWLMITHGVGPMRRYCIGAALLDLEDPSKVIGRLNRPLLEPEGNEREGYVPNVVYSCGALVHAGRLILPYGLSDRAAAIVSLSLDELLAHLVS